MATTKRKGTARKNSKQPASAAKRKPRTMTNPPKTARGLAS
ncbi:MAG: hypothetical protein ACJ8KA_03610 [Sulfurifustis sp.]